MAVARVKPLPSLLRGRFETFCVQPQHALPVALKRHWNGSLPDALLLSRYSNFGHFAMEALLSAEADSHGRVVVRL